MSKSNRKEVGRSRRWVLKAGSYGAVILDAKTLLPAVVDPLAIFGTVALSADDLIELNFAPQFV